MTGATAAAGIAISGGLPAASARADTTSVQLPISKYSHMLLDPARQHIFFTGGSGTDSILVTDFSGNSVATIPNEPGATAGGWAPMLAATPDGELVAAEPNEEPASMARSDVSSGTATVLAPAQALLSTSFLRSPQITPDGKDVVTTSGQVFRVSDLSADGDFLSAADTAAQPDPVSG